MSRERTIEANRRRNEERTAQLRSESSTIRHFIGCRKEMLRNAERAVLEQWLDDAKGLPPARGRTSRKLDAFLDRIRDRLTRPPGARTHLEVADCLKDKNCFTSNC